MKRLLIPLLLLLLAACQSAESTPIPTTTPAGAPTAVSPTATEAASETAAEAATAVPSTPTPSSAPITDDEARELMYTFTEGSLSDGETAVQRILAANDQRFAAIFIELFRARQIGIVRGLGVDDYVTALETLTGENYGPDIFAWVSWYGATDIQPPPGFTSWKGRLLQAIDPRFGEFLQDRYPSTIRVEEILWGGVVVDGIPALDNPAMLPADEADYLNTEDVVFGLSINGDNRAYPLRILDWHEMANDVIGGVPVSLAYCTLCGAAIAYDGRASDGTTYTFGSSGFLFRSNKLMYDRQTRTLWNQLTGEPVLGELVESEVTLNILPVVLTTWEDWRTQHPDTLVVDIDTGFSRQYTPGAAYATYFADTDTMFPAWQRSDLLDTKAQIFALRLNGVPKAYPLTTATAEKVVNDVLAGINLVLLAPGEIIEVDGVSIYAGPATYSAGAEVRAYERGEHTFMPGATENEVVDENGRIWTVTEDALTSPDGDTLPRLGGHLAYWFGWFAFFPNTLVYGVLE